MIKRASMKRDHRALKDSLETGQVQQISLLLSRILADVHVLYLKTLCCHWNIEDPRFISLHEMLETHYEELQDEADLIAERIRQIGGRAPASLKEYQALMSIKELTHAASGDEMLRNLLTSHEHIIAELRNGIRKTNDLEDYATADVLTEVLRAFDKRAWMLRCHF